MSPSRLFLSHSSEDNAFADLAVAELESPSMAAWIDTQQIIAGDDILDEIGHGLETMDVLVFLVSTHSLGSRWVNLELKYAIKEEIERKLILVVPFIIDDTPISALPWFLRHKNATQVNADKSGAKQIAETVRKIMKRRSVAARSPNKSFVCDPRIERLIKNIGPGNWASAYEAALEISRATDDSGENALFEELFTYLEADDQDLRWGAIQTIESFAQIAPWLFTHARVARMARNQDFSVRSSAAAICLELAQFAPDRVPVDIALRLATPYEDWYVMAPATAALKTMARTRPSVLRFFFLGLRSADSDIREHAASAIADIAEEEPEILDAKELAGCLSRLEPVGDKAASNYLAEALRKVGQGERASRFKYGL